MQKFMAKPLQERNINVFAGSYRSVSHLCNPSMLCLQISRRAQTEIYSLAVVPSFMKLTLLPFSPAFNPPKTIEIVDGQTHWSDISFQEIHYFYPSFLNIRVLNIIAFSNTQFRKNDNLSLLKPWSWPLHIYKKELHFGPWLCFFIFDKLS